MCDGEGSPTPNLLNRKNENRELKLFFKELKL